MQGRGACDDASGEQKEQDGDAEPDDLAALRTALTSLVMKSRPLGQVRTARGCGDRRWLVRQCQSTPVADLFLTGFGAWARVQSGAPGQP